MHEWSYRQAQRCSGTVGSLLLGSYYESGLVYIGHVGTGFTDETLTGMRRRLTVLRRLPARPATRVDPTRIPAAIGGQTWRAARSQDWSRSGPAVILGYRC
ncbi:hypothetical protein AB0I91_23090 [Actinosynnema sp. NPDC049800]